MANIGLDLDGCIYDFDLQMRLWLKQNGYGDLNPPTKWKCYEDWGMTFEVWFKEFEDSINSGFMFVEGEPIEGSLEVLTKLKEDGHQLHIVTHRVFGHRSVHNTMDWIQRVGLPFDTLTFAKDKTIVRTDFFIEDRLENYFELRRAGVDAVVFDQPWNQYWDKDENYEAIVPMYDRVFSWEDFYKIIKDNTEEEG